MPAPVAERLEKDEKEAYHHFRTSNGDARMQGMEVQKTNATTPDSGRKCEVSGGQVTIR
jgi:hypothetical protein